MEHKNHLRVQSTADRDLAEFIFRIIGVTIGCGERIQENGGGIRKCDLPRFYNANLGAIIHFNTPRGCTPRSSKSIRTIAPFLKSTRNSGVPSKSPVNELICGSCPTNSKLGSRRNARTSAHVSIGDAIGVNFEDSENSSS